MTLGELLKVLRESILNDRSDRYAGSSDYLWTDETLVTYINEAQRRFATKGFVLRDGTTDEVTKVALVPGKSTYDLHESIFAVMSARMEDGVADLARAGHQALAVYRSPNERWLDTASYVGLSPGAPMAYTTDETLNSTAADTFDQVTLRVYPAPHDDAAGTHLRLRVLRKPLSPLRIEALSETPEIPEDHHLEMLDWAAYLALRIVDDDAGAANRALEFKATFEQHIKEARRLVMQKLFAPMPWGFGRGGWSW